MESRHRRSLAHSRWVCLLLVLVAWPGLTRADRRTGVEAYEGGRFTDAFEALHPLARDGDPLAQFYIGYLYEQGQGVSADPREAVAWYRRAAEAGIARAQFNLGLAYEAGRGVEADAAEALRWFVAAADAGFSRGQYRAAEMYEAGRGTTVNLVEAHRWFALAGRERWKDARKRRKRVAKRMTPYEIAEAEMLARHWKQEQRSAEQ